MFYKNTLFVTPIFWYGILSYYSGTAIYDTYLYNCFNIFFTGLPIMYFALYDFHEEKHKFLENPKYYQIGFKSILNLLNLLNR